MENQSFLRMSEFLASKGVNNTDFMLKTYDKELVGVDPYEKLNTLHDENEVKKFKEKVFTECRMNIWYFFRVVFKVKDSYSTNHDYELNSATMAMIWAYQHGISVITHGGRQIGKTVTMLGLYIYDKLIKRNGCSTIHGRNIELTKLLEQQYDSLEKVVQKVLPEINSDVTIPLVNINFVSDIEFHNNVNTMLDYYMRAGVLISDSTINRGLDPVAAFRIDVLCPKFTHKFYDYTDEMIHAIHTDTSLVNILFSLDDTSLPEGYLTRMRECIKNDDSFKAEVLMERY